MPYFMQMFPNEFSTMRPVRLSYLDAEECASLADRPVQRRDGASRYSGFALETVYHYTSGHPYFTQVLCDRVIDLANRKHRIDISEADVEEAAESLIAGHDMLEPFRFDCLLSADNSGLVTDQRTTVYEQIEDPGSEQVFEVLARIAEISGSEQRPVPREKVAFTDSEDLVISDLVTRGVVDERGGLLIRVYLFNEYLRRYVQ